MLFLELKNAFHAVDYKILLDKLETYGIEGTKIKWFRSYLSERRQFYRIHDYNSKTMSVTCGIPQGSCLGLIFI